MSRPLRIQLSGGHYHVTSRVKQIAEHFGVHYSTVSRAVRKGGGGSG